MQEKYKLDDDIKIKFNLLKFSNRLFSEKKNIIGKKKTNNKN